MSCGFPNLDTPMKIGFTEVPIPCRLWSGYSWSLCEHTSAFLDLALPLHLDRDSHARAHLRMEACCRMLKYAWQDPSYNLADDDSLPKKMEKQFFENVQPQKKHR